MQDYRVASRYAKSLLELAMEKNAIEHVHQDMLSFERVCRQNRDFLVMLNSPVINGEKKFEVIKRIFEKDAHPITIAFFDILRKKKRENFLFAISTEVHALYNRIKGIKKAVIVTATPLTDHLRGLLVDLTKKAAGSEVEFVEKVDPSVIGGFQLRLEDKVLDKTIRKSLVELRREFSYNPYIKGI